MKIYDKTIEKCAYGHFDLDKKAGYTITDGDKLHSPWYYVYNNTKLLLYVDQNGPVKIQYQPPKGILVIKREIGETQSKWLTWVQSEDLNGGVAVNNFNSPKLDCNGEKPKHTVSFTPEIATYVSEYRNAVIKTEIFMPYDKATVSMKVTVKNTANYTRDFVVTPAVAPYVNVAQMVAWDLPEWYLSTRAVKFEDRICFCGHMTDPLMIKENERAITFNLDYDADAEIEPSMNSFRGNSSFFNPQSVAEKWNYSLKVKDLPHGFGGQASYVVKYNCTLKAGEEKTFTQVLTVQQATRYNDQENQYEKMYFDKGSYDKCVKDTVNFYDGIFNARKVKTNNQIFDNFMNYFTPLQMFWVCSLDRGWPSGMRGTRDASQDFMGIVPINPDWAKQTMLELFEHQRTDGWMPRQVSIISRTAPHDMRYFSDGGAFLLELVHEYLTFTRDKEFLNQKTVWLDSDEHSTVLEHIERCVDFYLDENNIGEHGLCKAWYGDWYDIMDQIGMDGIGESVTVTAQNVLNLKNLADMIDWLIKEKFLSDKYLSVKERYLSYRQRFLTGMREHAYNKLGYFNGYFNDNRKWLMSDEDPDGENRVYLVSNAWAVISGSATQEMAKSVIDNVKKENLGVVGYNTVSKGFPVYIDKAGRLGNGTFSSASPYNHAQSFYVRACCVAGDAEEAYKATRYIFPIEQDYAPVEKTFSSPYAIVNGYGLNHSAGFQFLSGTVSYVLRNFYNNFLGIVYRYDGLEICPCLPKALGDCEVEFTYLGKKFTVKYYQNQEKGVTFNGKVWDKTVLRFEGNKTAYYFADSDLKDENVIEIRV